MSTVPEMGGGGGGVTQVTMGRAHHVTQYENRVNGTGFNLIGYPELSSKIILRLIFSKVF